MLLRKLQAMSAEHLHVTPPRNRRWAAVVFVTGWSCERLATPVAEIRYVRTDCSCSPSRRPDRGRALAPAVVSQSHHSLNSGDRLRCSVQRTYHDAAVSTRMRNQGFVPWLKMARYL